MLRARSAQAPFPLQLQAQRAQRLLQSRPWGHLGQGRHARAFQAWVAVAAEQCAVDRPTLCWYRATAALIAKRTLGYDRRQAERAWQRWLLGTGVNQVSRLHRGTTVVGGWAPSALGGGCEAACEGPGDPSGGERPTALTPLSAQRSVQAEADKWGREWAAGAMLPPLGWPTTPFAGSVLPTLTIEQLRDAAGTFRAEVGLGWDQLHPRAVLRCPLAALAALVRLLNLAERIGHWPDTLQSVMICLLAKPQGGWIPIGLLPSVIRWWMRARLGIVREWQAACERPYFFARCGKPADVAAWKQAGRSDIVASRSGLAHACLLMDMEKAFEWGSP